MAWLHASVAAAAVIVADQSAKSFVLARPACAAAATASRAFFAITCVINRRGAALPPLRRMLRATAFVLCAVLAAVALTQEPLRHSSAGATGIGLALGGIAGNYIDLTRRNGIVDFIAIGPLPVCNIADLAIAFGATLTGIVLLRWTLV